MATIRPMRAKWQAIVRRKGYPDQSKTFLIKRDAEKWAREQERLIDSGQWVNRTEAEQTTLEEALERYANEVSTSKRGVRAELNRIELFKRSQLATYSIASITGRLVATWRDDRLKQVSSGTVLRELLLLSHVFTVAVREWGMALNGNPVAVIRKPKAGKPRDRILTDKQRADLVSACSECQNSWVKPVVIFALETACRRGEILSLQWTDVELGKSTAKVSGKTGSRTIPLSPACIGMLTSLPRSLGGQVFPISVEALKQAYERAVKRAGIQDFTFHDLRHDALTRLAKMGLNVLELRAVSGHTTANMLQRYVNIDAQDLAIKLVRFS